MFTINIYLRFALIALCLVGGTILAFAYGFWYAFPFLLAGVILLAGYILLGTVQSAAQLLQEQKFEEAEQRLGLTIKPEWLFTTNRAYYNMLKGTLAGANKDMDSAASYFSEAQSIGLGSDNETAMVELQMANIAASKGKWQQAQVHLKKLKSLKVTEPQIKEQVQQMEKAMKNRGAAKAAGRAGINPMTMKPGGKRRRPRMR